MQFKSFLYRQKQRFKYHTAKDIFEKKVAEINRFEEKVSYDQVSFQIKGCGANFYRTKHQFILDGKGLDNFLWLHNFSGGKFWTEEEDLLFKIDRIILKVKTSEELFILREIYFNKCYNFIIPNEEIVVLDIGMNVGYASLFFAAKPEVKKIYSFEPFAQTYGDAIENFKINPNYEHKIIPRNFGLSNTSKAIQTLYSSKRKGLNSSCSHQKTNVDQAATIELVNIVPELSKIVEENNESTIIIKIDCEGAEFEIFEAFYSRKLPVQVKGILLEWHFKKPDPIVEYLLSQRFKLVNTSLEIETGLIYAFR